MSKTSMILEVLLGAGYALLFTLIVGIIITFFSGCGKSVEFDFVDPRETEVEIVCLYQEECTELGTKTKQAPISVTFKNVPVAHDKGQICNSFRLHGSTGKEPIGCNDDAEPTSVVVQTKLANEGQCQQVTLFAEHSSLGKLNSKAHPGNFYICPDTGELYWNVEDFKGTADYNDAEVEVTSSEANLAWLLDDEKLYLCLESRK